MTTTLQLTSETRLPWRDDVVAWCRQEYGDAARARVVKSWLRPFSEIHLLSVEMTGRTETLIGKRTVHDPGNEIYRSRGNAAEIEFNALQRVHERSAGECPVPRPRLVIPEFDLLLMDFAVGESLERFMASARITANKASLAEANRQFTRTGRWLKSFQDRLDVRHAGAEILDQTLAHCDDRLRMIEEHRHPQVAKNLRSGVMRDLESLQASVHDPIAVSDCHGDFGPWNVLVASDRITVTDFFSHRRDCVLTDLLGMLIYLESQAHSPSFNARRVQQLQRAFGRGFDCQIRFEPSLLRLCETHQRIRRIHDGLLEPGARWSDRYRIRRVIRDNLNWIRSCRVARCIDLSCKVPVSI